MRCPRRAPGIAVAIADKLDTLAGIFAIGEQPTGNKDPFGLRRGALGVQRILIEKGLELDLKRLIDLAVAGVRADIDRVRARRARPPPRRLTWARTSVAAWIYDFLMERLRAYYLERVSAAPGRAGGDPGDVRRGAGRAPAPRRWILMRA